MVRQPNRKNKPTTPVPIDEADQLQAWQQSTGRSAGDKASTPVPARSKLLHGIFANRIFGNEELALFSVMIEIFREETSFNGSGDMVQLELLCIYCLKISRAVMAEQWDAVERLDRMIRMHMADLKLTRKMREGEGPSDGAPNPLDYAMELVERARQRLAERAQEVTAGEEAGAKTEETPRRTPGEADGAPRDVAE